MTYPRAPELATRIGCLDDEAFAVDASADAWGLRELVRNGNTFLARGGLMFRELGNVAGTDTETQAQGAKLSTVWPIWQACLALPEQGMPVPKKPGLTQMRMRVRATITSGRTVLLQVGTRLRPFNDQVAYAQVLEMLGTGALAVYEKNDVEVDVAEGELLSFFAQTELDYENDPLLVTATYGGASTGTTYLSPRSLFWDQTLATPWNTTGAQVHLGGHYVLFRSTSADKRVLWGPCPIVEVYRESPGAGEALYFYPEPPPELLGVELDYQIRKLPEMRLHSVACYSVDRGL